MRHVQNNYKFPLVVGAVLIAFLVISNSCNMRAIGSKDTHSVPNMLNLEQLRNWNREGFLVIKQGMPQDQVTILRKYLEEMHIAPPKRGGLWKYHEPAKDNKSAPLLNRIEKFASYHTGMKEFISQPFIRGISEDLLGGEVALFKEKVNYKLPGGGGFEPHQDMQPGWTKYAPQMVSVLLCVDANTIENGALYIAPGAHARPGGLIGRMKEPLNETETMGLTWIPVETQPGDLVFFDAWSPHKSAPNLSGKARRNTYVTWNRAKYGYHRQQYYADKFKSLPPDADREEGKVYQYRV